MDDQKNQITDELINSPRPVALKVIPENIPERLKRLDQWVLWVYQFRNGEWTKVPQYTDDIRGTSNASSTNASTWMTYERAAGFYVTNPGQWDGIGFMLTPKSNLTGVDVDKCIGADGQLSEDAEAEIRRFKSYAERSPSGRGIRVFVLGPLKGEGRKKGPYEIYNGERFLTVTGHRIGDHTAVHERVGEIAEFHRTHILNPNAPPSSPDAEAGTIDPTGAPQLPDGVVKSPPLTDSAVLGLCRTAKNSDKFVRLWAGDTTDYHGDHSSADIGLVHLMAFYTQCPEQLDRLFRQSALFRPGKWDRPYSGFGFFGEREIHHVLGRLKETYRGTVDQQLRADERRLKDRIRTDVAIDEVAAGDELHHGEQTKTLTVKTEQHQEGAEDQPEDDRVYRFRPLTSAQMADTVYTMEWLVHGVLVKGQPTIIGGPKKSLKTNSLVDLCVSLGTGTPFLGEFKANKARVCFVSGESGGFTIKETALRVCKAKGVQLRDVDCLWDFRLPKLAVQDELAELATGLKQHGVQVVIIDPLYLCLLSGAPDKSASNMFDMGPLLMDVSRACISVGTMPILVHHSKKTLLNNHDPLELEDLAYGGVQEFARQWLLLSRREKFVPGSGRHQLWLASGGSVGHGGLWAVDIDEGIVDEQFGGRKWDVDVKKPAEVKAEKQEQKRAEKEAEKDEEEQRLQSEYLKVVDENPDPVTKMELRSALGWRHEKLDRIHRQLLRGGVVVATSGPKNSTLIHRKRV